MVTQLPPRYAWLCLAGLVACKPDLEGRPSLVQSARVLALRSSPAEAPPDARVSFDALFVGPDGPGTADGLSWALCNARKALTDSGSIALPCLQLEGEALIPLEPVAGMVSTSLPRDACETFGPTPKTPKPGEPNARAVDPDTTGGYYVPVRVAVEGDQTSFAVGVTRLTCALGGATQEQSAMYTRLRRPNENPRLTSLLARRDDDEEEQTLAASNTPDAQPTLTVGQGERVQLSAHWPDCPLQPSCGDGICSPGEDQCAQDCSTAQGCAGSEPYVYFDPLTRRLVDRREVMRVSWFATDGAFEHERTGQAGDDAEIPSSLNIWQAPDAPADVRLWVVLRDDRGGVGWGSYRLQVE